jgi:hypothetical protein
LRSGQCERLKGSSLPKIERGEKGAQGKCLTDAFPVNFKQEHTSGSEQIEGIGPSVPARSASALTDKAQVLSNGIETLIGIDFIRHQPSRKCGLEVLGAALEA